MPFKQSKIDRYIITKYVKFLVVKYSKNYFQYLTKEFCTTFCFAYTLGLLALCPTLRWMSTAKRQNIALRFYMSTFWGNYKKNARNLIPTMAFWFLHSKYFMCSKYFIALNIFKNTETSNMLHFANICWFTVLWDSFTISLENLLKYIYTFWEKSRWI